MACSSSEDSDKPGHPPTLIRIFAVSTEVACPAGIWCQNAVVSTLMRSHHVASTLLRSHFYVVYPLIGVGRFRILGGCQGLEYWGGGGGGGGASGGPNSQQAHDVVTTSMRRNDVISTSCAH